MSKKDRQVERYIKGMRKQERKQKVRDSARKTDPKDKEKKPRQKNIATPIWDDWENLDEMPDLVPIQSVDERERRRLVERHAATGPSDGSRPSKYSTALSGLPQKDEGGHIGLVLEAGFGMCRIDHEGETWLCDLRGNLKGCGNRVR